MTGIDHVHQRQQSRADGDVEHQVGDALVMIFDTKAVEPPFQFLHWIHLEKALGLFYQLGEQMSIVNYEYSMKV